jgi:hypothetical protein
MDSPRQVVDQLIRIFPAFLNEWDEGESYGFKGKYNYHCVFQEFTPVSHMLFNKATTSQIKEFCELINSLIEIGGVCENAVSTCFLEHASQVGVSKIIAPYLSKEAKKELR